MLVYSYLSKWFKHMVSNAPFEPSLADQETIDHTSCIVFSSSLFRRQYYLLCYHWAVGCCDLVFLQLNGNDLLDLVLQT